MKTVDIYNTFLAALSFFTRIPVNKELSEDNFKNSVQYLPFIGYITGSVWSLSTILLMKVLPLSFSVVSGIFAGILVTGALHEDGFADFCDGFGGGYTRDSILRIMKDSATGVFGTLGLISVFASRYSLIISCSQTDILPLILGASVSSRIMPLIIPNYIEYIKSSGSKSTSVSSGVPKGAIFTATLSLIPLFFIINPLVTALALTLQLTAAFILIKFLKVKIQGYTGDTLGAAVVTGEFIYLISYYLI